VRLGHLLGGGEQRLQLGRPEAATCVRKCGEIACFGVIPCFAV